MRQRLVGRRPIQPHFFEFLRGVELVPEIERHLRQGGARRRNNLVDKPQQRAGKVLRSQPIHGRKLALYDSVLQRSVRKNRVHQRCDVHRILVIKQYTGAIHRRGHGGRRVGEHWNLLVERFDQRNTEAFVLARAQKQIGTFVKRHQLRVRHVADEMHVLGAKRRDQLVQ